MTSPSVILRQLIDPASFFARFEARLKVLNAAYGIHLTSGIELDYVQAQWAGMCDEHTASLDDNICRIFAQGILGELCNGLTRFESVMMAGNHASAAGSEEEEQIREFISRYARTYVAVEFCSDIYREVMPFGSDMYTTTKSEVMNACEIIEADPDRGREFVHLLKYPDKLKILN